MSNISQNLRKMRETKGLSQEKLARLSDVANNTIVKIEAGKNKNPTLDTLKKVAKVLGVSIDELTK
ncbi:helix-turn-helix transcriptional regulator [Candidatus Wolfebacteria bacterium]|nr:helix-turn-helix transcriptional regulator [Candidatus Wolfebacteria bacterium]